MRLAPAPSWARGLSLFGAVPDFDFDSSLTSHFDSLANTELRLVPGFDPLLERLLERLVGVPLGMVPVFWETIG